MVLSTAVKEMSFADLFREFVGSETDEALRALREQAFQAFTSMGFPTQRDENWKYTNVAPIGRYEWRVQAPERNSPATDTEALGAFYYLRNGFTALNLAFANVQVVRISRDTAVEEPIKLQFQAEMGSAIFPHVIVIAEAGCRATLVEYYSSPDESFTNTAVQVFVESNAHLTHYRVQKDSANSYHVGTTEVSLGSGSNYDSTNINLGGAISRHDIEVKFTDEGGEAWVDGLFMLGGSQHADTHSIIDHRVPNCTSHQTYRGVLNDSSRGVFNGKVFVRENARGTDAQQSNKNLLLSAEARVDTKPQLEIFNDDVKCSHGATVGQLEEEELFYLRTRGLNDELARNLLTYGFAEEVLNKIQIDSIKTELDAAVLNRLSSELGS